MTREQGERLAAVASDTLVATQGLLFRLRWSRLYEEALVKGESPDDVRLMALNQEEFEDQPIK